MSEQNDNIPMLEIENLSVRVEDKELLRDINMKINSGEVHVLFGPNGSGKSSLVNVIMGLPGYKITSGDILYKGESIKEKTLTERGKMGIGLAYQHPPVVEGVTLEVLLKAISEDREDKEVFAEETNLRDYLHREVNVGFSGGERKRGELLQLLVQQPELVLLDEPDSGVDVDNIDLIVKIIRRLLQKDIAIRNRRNSGLIVTHSGTILERIHGDKGYVMVGGRIFCSGAPLDIFDQIKTHGFSRCIEEASEK